ncbi:hypothetical protein [Haloarcula laminariae]|uniref:hypothetical protein n=1 Tax=Haloarcula laminariae TaxID=2961577 RepID=UPI002406B6F1|nr:hypothetical protein [Halomicroarcula sp. FL173]
MILDKVLSLLGADRWKVVTAAVMAVAGIASANPSTASGAYAAVVAIVVAGLLAVPE